MPVHYCCILVPFIDLDVAVMYYRYPTLLVMAMVQWLEFSRCIHLLFTFHN
jgi:hypothetical protein